jgi:hypothetical protein
MASGAPTEVIRALLATQPTVSARIIGLREKGCRAIGELCAPNLSPAHEAVLEGMRDQLVDFGALDAACNALACHPLEPGVVVHACLCLHNVCSGQDDGGMRKKRAADAGAISTVIGALRKAKGPRAAEVIEAAYRTLDLICYNEDLQAHAGALGYEPPPSDMYDA